MKLTKLLGSVILLMFAAQGNGKTTVEYLNNARILPSGLPFSEAVRVGDTLYLSGQIGLDPKTGKVVSGGIQSETRQVMTNIKAVLNANQLDMKDVVKCLVMLADIKEWPAFNEVYKKAFVAPFPARSAFAADGLALNARVEVECIAAYSH